MGHAAALRHSDTSARLSGMSWCLAGTISGIRPGTGPRGYQALCRSPTDAENAVIKKLPHKQHRRIVSSVERRRRRNGGGTPPDGTTPRRLCFLRQQQVLQKNAPYLCLADFISPHRPPSDADIHVLPIGNVIGLLPLPPKSPWNIFMTMTTSNACWCKRSPTVWPKRRLSGSDEQVRQTLWGYAPSERFSCQELFSEKYQGRRPAIGYPSMPDQSFIFDFAKFSPWSASALPSRRTA